MKHIITVVFLSFFMISNTYAEKAYFAGGCFWCVESDYEALEGVQEAISGFTGGDLENPTYQGNHQGHYEAVEVIYDPKVISYEKLVEYFWLKHDPFDSKGQFCDKGSAYLAAIFVQNEKERKIAEDYKSKVQKLFPKQNVVTPVLSFKKFYPIKGKESYHQDYYKNYSTKYKFYRWNCGRDKRIKDIWGERKTI